MYIIQVLNIKDTKNLTLQSWHINSYSYHIYNNVNPQQLIYITNSNNIGKNLAFLQYNYYSELEY